jgi:hypothetical protein
LTDKPTTVPESAPSPSLGNFTSIKNQSAVVRKYSRSFCAANWQLDRVFQPFANSIAAETLKEAPVTVTWKI